MFPSMRQLRRIAAWPVLGAALAACTGVQIENREPAREIAQQRARPPGSAYAGWRVFQQRCAECHGPEATGGAGGPDLMPRVATMGERRFVDLVLRRYRWDMPAAQAGSEGAAREALIEQILRRDDVAVTMPAWQDEPIVAVHIADLYTWLSGRAAGTLAPGRPVR